MTRFPALLRLPAFLRTGFALLNPGGTKPEPQLLQPAEDEISTDTLTGIPNRRHFLRLAGGKLNLAAQSGQGCAILLINLDRFRAVNERFGHAAGDAVLTSVAQRLNRCLPVENEAGRLGGDEFAVILGPAADLRIPFCVEQLAGRIGGPIAFAGRAIEVGASIGIALAPDDGADAAALLAAADERIYLRKRNRLRTLPAAA